MLSHCCRWFIACALALALGSATTAQESPPPAENLPPAEKTYLDLRRSTDKTTQMMAERYFNLVKLQEWSDAAGKSKIMAKYVAHDPNLTWVKLEAVRGSGATRVVKEIQIPVERLSKKCQSRVRQVDTLQKKLDELAVAEAEKEGSAGQTEAGGDLADGRGAPMLDERGVDPRQAGEVVADRSAPGEYDRRSVTPPPTEPAPPAGESGDDPLGFGELQAVPGSEALGLSAPPSAGAAQRSGERAVPEERPQWATNYDAFYANFAVAPDERGEVQIDWGELQELRTMSDAVAAATSRDGEGDSLRQRVAEGAKRLGEVHWQVPFMGLDSLESGEGELRLRLPPLPEPLTIRFLLDQRESIRRWAELQPAQTLQVVGQFDMVKPLEIIVRVRLAEPPVGQPAEESPRSAPAGDFVPTPNDPR